MQIVDLLKIAHMFPNVNEGEFRAIICYHLKKCGME